MPPSAGRNDLRAAVDGEVPADKGHDIGRPGGVTVTRWPPKYLTPQVCALAGLFLDCDRAKVPPLTAGLLAWPAPLAAAWSCLRSETDLRDEARRGR
jgi:hypothetical protein